MRASAAVAAASAAFVLVCGSAAAASPTGTWYTVAFKSGTLPANVDKLVADAGGTIAVSLPEIGGLGVVSSNPGFPAKIGALASVAAAASSTKTSIPSFEPNQSAHQAREGGQNAGNHGGGGSGDGGGVMPDQLGPQQWDKIRIGATNAGSYAVDRGRKEVRVALTDTGVDQNHPDIRANLDVASSRSFVPGEPTIQDYNGHGTWTASAVGAPINKIGISGVAPNVTLVELKTNDANGNGLLLFLDQALIYAAHKHFDVVSSSIIAYAPTCATAPPPCDNADYLLAQRAVTYARDRGVTIVAALGNDNLDVSDPAALGSLFDQLDPASAPTGGVVEALGGLQGVIGVSATGFNDQKSFYSNYGLGAVAVAAPGGDSVFQPAPAPYVFGGRLIGAYSSTAPPSPYAVTDCVGSTCGLYIDDQGTSMATPNAAGVAALIISRYGDFSQNGDRRSGRNDNGDGNRSDGGGTHMPPDLVAQRLLGSATPLPCPPGGTAQYPGIDGDPFYFVFPFATCQTGPGGSNGFYGAGLVNAARAVGQNAN